MEGFIAIYYAFSHTFLRKISEALFRSPMMTASFKPMVYFQYYTWRKKALVTFGTGFSGHRLKFIPAAS